MAAYRNFGVKTDEISVFQQSVIEVETALPAFVGYTAKAIRKNVNDLRQVPTKINSMREFENLFGFPYENEIEMDVTCTDNGGFVLSDFKESSLLYILYYSVKIYFDNGGGCCYILSVDAYLDPPQVVLTKNAGSPIFGLLDGLYKLTEVGDISLVLIPEAVKLCKADYSLLVQAALLQCHTLDNRFAIFDLYNGDCSCPDLNLNRDLFGKKYLNCGSAYYPFIKTTINSYIGSNGSNVKIAFSGDTLRMGDIRKTNFPLYKFVNQELKKRYIVLPSCGAIAGTYVTTDKKRGVWKSPVNLNLAGVSEPVVNLVNQSCSIQNVDTETGKSINSIRTDSGKGKGTIVLGARTLANNDNDGRFVSVRRFIIMVKESLRKSTSWAVFESNDLNTLIKVRAMIENYLTLKWQEGALAGVIPQQAFYVSCELGSTMSAKDILEGTLNIEIGLAMLQPSEFVIINISHQLMKASSYLTVNQNRKSSCSA